MPGGAEAGAELDWVVRFIGEVRAVRAEMNVPAATTTPVLLRDAAPGTLARAARWIEPIRRMARVTEVAALDGAMPAGSAQAVLDEATLILPLAGVIDLAAERARLGKERAKAAAEAEKLDRKLANADFVRRAPEEVVEENRAAPGREPGGGCAPGRRARAPLLTRAAGHVFARVRGEVRRRKPRIRELSPAGRVSGLMVATKRGLLMKKLLAAAALGLMMTGHRARAGLSPDPAAAHGDGAAAAGHELHLGRRSLALEWRAICVGAGPLRDPPRRLPSMGAGALGEPGTGAGSGCRRIGADLRLS